MQAGIDSFNVAAASAVACYLASGCSPASSRSDGSSSLGDTGQSVGIEVFQTLRAGRTASCAPGRGDGPRTRCRSGDRSRAAGSARAVRCRQSRPPRRSRPDPDRSRGRVATTPGRPRAATGSLHRPCRGPAPCLRQDHLGLHSTPAWRTWSSSGQSKTNTARSTPTWFAARPTPSAAVMVANMSWTSPCRLSS